MATILDQIIVTKRQEVEAAQQVVSLAELKAQVKDLPAVHSLRCSLQSHRGGIISEFKRRSPSKDWINRTAQVAEIIPAYQAAGAAALSILTDTTYFGGSLQDVKDARPLTTLPILRKDFVIGEYQLYEARVAGADACLLIAAVLGKERCKELAQVAHELGLETILEVHCAEELEACSEHIDVLGVNNRNLKLFKTDTQISEELFPLLPSGPLPISESGLLQASKAQRLQQVGYKGFLIGEAFMKTSSPGDALAQYISQLL